MFNFLRHKNSAIKVIGKAKTPKPKISRRKSTTSKKRPKKTTSKKTTSKKTNETTFATEVLSAKEFSNYFATIINASQAKKQRIENEKLKSYDVYKELYANGKITKTERDNLCKKACRDARYKQAKLDDKEARKNRRAFGTKRSISCNFVAKQNNGLNLGDFNLNIDKK